jgi:hypothetical protein
MGTPGAVNLVSTAKLARLPGEGIDKAGLINNIVADFLFSDLPVPNILMEHVAVPFRGNS